MAAILGIKGFPATVGDQSRIVEDIANGFGFIKVHSACAEEIFSLKKGQFGFEKKQEV
jgi:hypothetical protein